MKFCSFSSGSDGNCYYIGTDTCGILIDAGISVKAIKKNLEKIGTSIQKIYAVFLTHDHYDHIASVGTLGEVYHIPVYSTCEILNGVNRCYKVTEKLYGCRHYQSKGETVEIGDIQITSFQVYHDSSDCVGYYIEQKGVPKNNITIATDLGYINNEAIPFIIKANNIVIESNYDEEMLLSGPYPLFLKQRILSKSGHLANHITATFLAENNQDNWKRIFFCHLSNKNNTPERVESIVKSKYDGCMIDEKSRPQFIILPRTKPIEPVNL
ncbi:MAG: MBL fold metallo-hydrolase [Paludibacteraceae bacterium]|nr:MBL fold metallo-hydrolase [Paludibacteraceae bacterium]